MEANGTSTKDLHGFMYIEAKSQRITVLAKI
jgi:hypothetical protein